MKENVAALESLEAEGTRLWLTAQEGSQRAAASCRLLPLQQGANELDKRLERCLVVLRQDLAGLAEV